MWSPHSERAGSGAGGCQPAGWRTFSRSESQDSIAVSQSFIQVSAKNKKRNFFKHTHIEFCKFNILQDSFKETKCLCSTTGVNERNRDTAASGEDAPQGGRPAPAAELGVHPAPSFPATWSVCVSQGRQTGLLKCAFNLKLLHKNRMNCFALMKCRPYLYIRLVLPSVCPYPPPPHPHSPHPHLSPTPAWASSGGQKVLPIHGGHQVGPYPIAPPPSRQSDC